MTETRPNSPVNLNMAVVDYAAGVVGSLYRQGWIISSQAPNPNRVNPSRTSEHPMNNFHGNPER